MATKLRINLASQAELLEAGLSPDQAEAVVRHRVQHGPIANVRQLAEVVGAGRLPEGLDARADFSPSDATAPEAPGA